MGEGVDVVTTETELVGTPPLVVSDTGIVEDAAVLTPVSVYAIKSRYLYAVA